MLICGPGFRLDIHVDLLAFCRVLAEYFLSLKRTDYAIVVVSARVSISVNRPELVPENGTSALRQFCQML